MTDITFMAMVFRENYLLGLDLARSIRGAGTWLETAYVFSEEDSRIIGKLMAMGLIREEAFDAADGFGQKRLYYLRPSEYPFTEAGEERVNKLLGQDPAATELNSKGVHGMTEDDLEIVEKENKSQNQLINKFIIRLDDEKNFT